jgi:orotidine 5'-phosphate decarboxylase subfamily 2
MKFNEKLQRIVKKNNSILCVGLDIDENKMPKFLFKKIKDPFFEFNKLIIDATHNLVCAYKLNMAFYEVLGKKGFELIEKTVKYIPKDVVVILDGKRNDISNTAGKYAKSLFKILNADAITVNPYLGIDGIKPFLDYKDKCSFILCRTSNLSAGDFQDIKSNNVPLYQNVAKKIKEWNSFGNCGAVVGATYPDELKMIRNILGEDIPILIPGVGKQGGDIEKTVIHGTNSKSEMAIINSSRGIIFAGKDENFAEESKKAVIHNNDIINSIRQKNKLSF